MVRNKKIALVAVNSRTSHTNLALYYIKKMLSEYENAECSLIELTINENWKQSLERLTDTDYDYFLFSLYIWNSSYIKEIAPMLRKIQPDAKIVFGGPEISYNSTEWEKTQLADILVKGQAEEFISSLFTCNKSVYYSENRSINEIPFPYDREDYENLKGRLVYYESSRGCLFNCSYCLSSCSDQKLEYRDLNIVKEELKQLISIEPKIVKMVDRTFNSNQKFAREVWKFLIELESPVPFHFELHPLFLEDEDFKILSVAPQDLFHFEVGIQSTNKKVLSAVNRPYNWDRERENIKKLCRIENIHTHLDQIVALPEDNRDFAIQSFNEILGLYPDEFQLGFLKIIQGTGLSENVNKYKMIVNPNPPYEVIQTQDMSFSHLKEFYSVENNLNRYYNSHYFVKSLTFLLKKSSTPWIFFSQLLRFSPEDKMVKRWAVLGESLKLYAEKYLREEVDYLCDLLRLDWCPYASGQNFPPFLRLNDGDELKDSRRKTYEHLFDRIENFTRRDFNHSILFKPQTERLKLELNHQAILFYRTDKVLRYPIKLDLI